MDSTSTPSSSADTVEAPLATVIDGRKIADTIQAEVKAGVEELAAKTEGKGKPGLGVVLVGSRGDSATYVRMKRNAAQALGFHFHVQQEPDTITEEDLIKVVRTLNADPSIHGLIVQLPLPSHICERKVLSEVSTDKDVDGFHPINIGRLAMKGHNPQFIPGTPKGIMMLLERSGVKIAGKQAVVIGRSNIVGTPIALLLMHADATVTICHSRTPEEDMIRSCRNADIVIAAAGRPEMVKADWIKPGATVIDVGTNSVPDATRKTGYRLVGDVAYAEVRKVAGGVSPVPGGVGPMTVAMLLLQTLESAKRHYA